MYEFQMFFQEAATTIGIAVIGFGAFALCHYIGILFYNAYKREAARIRHEEYIAQGGKSISEMLDEIENSIKEEEEKTKCM